MPFIIRIVSSFVLLCLLWIALVVLQLGNPTQGSRWVHEVYALKESRALEINTKKMVIVSGSNSLFGFNSKSLEKHFQLPVINTAVHAGLGMSYILYRSKKVLIKGDIAILPLEYSFYRADGKPSEVYSDYILSRDEKRFSMLPWTEQLTIISSVGFNRLYKGLSYFLNPMLLTTSGVYGVQNVNLHGDQINIEPSKMTKSEKLAIDSSTPSNISLLDISISSHFIDAMDEYIKWADAEGVCVIAMPPNYMYFSEYSEEPYSVFLSNIKAHYASRDIKFIGDPYAYMFEKKYYFNTKSHLNSEGVQKRTQQALSDIGSDINIHCNSI